MTRALSIAALLLLPTAARADVPTQGYSRVPRDCVIEVDTDYRDYRFFPLSPRGVEPLAPAPGRPFRIDGTSRVGGHRTGHIVAVPVSRAEKFAEETKAIEGKATSVDELYPPGTLHSDHLDFQAYVPFYNPQRRIVARYHLELDPSTNKVQLVPLGESAGSAWVVAAVAAAIGIVWLGWRLLRRARRGRGDLSSMPDRTPRHTGRPSHEA